MIGEDETPRPCASSPCMMYELGLDNEDRVGKDARRRSDDLTRRAKIPRSLGTDQGDLASDLPQESERRVD